MVSSDKVVWGTGAEDKINIEKEDLCLPEHNVFVDIYRTMLRYRLLTDNE